MKTYVIAAMHGNEVFGLKVLGALQPLSNPNIMVRVGHPEGVAKQKRYIETDLNRSFNSKTDSNESRLAQSIQAEINNYEPNCIIDIHTSVSNVKKVAIVVEASSFIKDLATAVGMDAIVIMPPQIAKGSLIGCYPDRAISIEFGRLQRSDKLATNIAKNIYLLGSQQEHSGSVLKVFKVVSTIPKEYPGLKDIENLKFNAKLGGYPFLAGENTYPTIGGFLAMEV